METFGNCPNKVSTINDVYDIIEKKGVGASCTVYLVENKENEEQYAVKILNKNSNETLFQNEITILEKLKKLNNQYLINLIEFDKVETSTSEEYEKYLILDYAEKGDLVAYLFFPKRGFIEKHAKLIFKKILEGVKACHDNGICHRDLKIQNILLDKYFNPKICDFGFATEIRGKDGSGKLHDYLGTRGYEAPEIIYNIPYDGTKVDIFSLGVILINLVTAKHGFCEAKSTDDYYKWIIIKNFNEYWKNITPEVGNTSEAFKYLFQKMVCLFPNERPTINEILNDPWMKEINDLNEKEYQDLEKEVREDFKERENIIKKSNETVEASDDNNETNKKRFRGLDKDEKEYFDLDLKPKYYKKTGFNMKNYMKINGKLDPAAFMNTLANEINSEFSEKCKIETNSETLQFNVIFENEEDEEKEEKKEKSEEDKKIEEELKKLNIDIANEGMSRISNSIIQIDLLQSVNDGHLVRFEKKGGDIRDYYNNFTNIKNIIKKIL